MTGCHRIVDDSRLVELSRLYVDDGVLLVVFKVADCKLHC